VIMKKNQCKYSIQNVIKKCQIWKTYQIFEATSLVIDGGVFDVTNLGRVELGRVVGKVAIVDSETDL